MLAERLELHAPQCRAGSGSRCDCHPILDLEGFVAAVVAAHFGVGTKRRDGTLTGSPWLSPEDREDVRAYLLGEAWIAAQRFDGRGRLTGYVLAQLHFRATDWTRLRFGSTRATATGPAARGSAVRWGTVELHADISQLGDEPTFDDDLEALTGRELPYDLSPYALEALKLVAPMVDRDLSRSEYVRETGVAFQEITRAVKLLRRELELDRNPSFGALLRWAAALPKVRRPRTKKTAPARLGPASLRRREAVALLRGEAGTAAEVGELLGVSGRTVREWARADEPASARNAPDRLPAPTARVALASLSRPRPNSTHAITEPQPAHHAL